MERMEHEKFQLRCIQMTTPAEQLVLKFCAFHAFHAFRRFSKVYYIVI